jgi:AcrR family transcriptional regulator
MPNASKGRSTSRPRRRRSRSETRERLVTAALELLHSGGEAAVSTVSVTRAAGIVQSAFYQHFANVEACLAAAAERVAGHIREAVSGARRAMYQSGPGTGENLEHFYRTVFELASRERPLVELFLRHRTDRLALNGVMHRLARDLCADLARDLAEQTARAGWTALPPDWVEAVADNLVGASLSAIEARLNGCGPGVEESARLLAAFTTGACHGVFEASQGLQTAGQ